MKAVFLIGVALAAAACDKADDKHPGTTTAASTAAVAADNTRKNERDTNPSAVTPGDQKENEVDLGITQQIRQGVIKDESLSMTAKNVKIITADGVVTLRGPVKSDKEKTTIAALAQATTGVKRVDNLLEIEAP